MSDNRVNRSRKVARAMKLAAVSGVKVQNRRKGAGK